MPIPRKLTSSKTSKSPLSQSNVIQSSFSEGPVVYGSKFPGQFIKDMKNGVDSVDILFVGDSNVMSSIGGTWGYASGFSESLFNSGAIMYGGAIYPTMTGWTIAANYSLGGWRGNCYSYRPVGSLLSGVASGGSTAYAAWTPGSNWARYGNASPTAPTLPSSEDWAYIPTGTYTDNYNAVELSANSPLNVAGQVLYHRIRYGMFSTAGGSFTPRSRAYDGSPIYTASPTVSTTGTNDFAAHEYPFTLTAPVESIHCSWSGISAIGPCAMHSHSIYAKRKGWSITSHGYLAGYSSTQAADVITNVGIALKLHLRETRERQIAAGGSGRVIIAFTAGVNGNENPSAWVAAASAVWETYKSAWTSLGFPSESLGFVAWVTHQPNEADTSNTGSVGNLVPVRAAANALPYQSGSPDMTVVDTTKLLTYKQLVSGVGNGRAYYQRYSNLPSAGSDITVHLSGGTYTGSTFDTSDGYTLMSHLIINSLIQSAS